MYRSLLKTLLPLTAAQIKTSTQPLSSSDWLIQLATDRRFGPVCPLMTVSHSNLLVKEKTQNVYDKTRLK